MPLTERQQMAFLLEMTAKEFKEETDKRKENNDEQENKKSAGSSKSELSKIHKRNKRGETPLHLAAIKGDIDSVQSLINKGADVNVTDHAGWSPLHEACSRGHYKIVKILLKAGADANAKGLEDDTPLHDACSNEHIKIVRILLKYGADPRKRNEDLETPLDLAASLEISDFLEEYLALSDAEKEKFGLSVGSMSELSSDDDYYGEDNVNKPKEKDNNTNAKQTENDNDNNNKQEPKFITKLNKDAYSVTDSSDDDSKSKSGSRTAEKCLVDENLDDDDDDEGDFTPKKKKRRSNSFSKRILSDDEEDESLAVIRDGFAKEKKLRELEKASTLSEESTSKEQTIASQTVLGHTVTKFHGKQSSYMKDESSGQSEFLDDRKKIEKLGPKKHRDSSSEEKTLKVQEHKKTKKKMLRSNILKKDPKNLELGRKETVDAKEVQNVDTKRDDNDNVTLKKKRIFKESQGGDSKEREISGDKNKVDDLTQGGNKVNTEKHKKRKKLPNYALFEEEDPKKAKSQEKILIRSDKKGKIENDGKMEKKSPEKNKSTKEETVKPNKQNIDQTKLKKVVNKISPIKFSHELSESPFFFREELMTGKNLLAKKNKLGKKLQSDIDRKLKPLKAKRTSNSVSKDSGVTAGKRKGRDSESEGVDKPIKKLKKGERVSESELSLHESSEKQTRLIGESNEVSENLQETKMPTVVDVINSENISSDTESPDDNIRLIDLVVSKETKECDQDIDVNICKKDETTTQECTAQSSSAFNDNPYISDISDAENVDEDENLPKERMTNDMFRVNIFNQRLNQVPQQLSNTGAPPEAESKPDASFNDGSGSSSLAKPVPASDVTNQEARICSPLAKQEQMTDINSSDDKKASESPDKPAEISDLPTSTEFCTIDNSNSIEINHSSSVRKDDELVPLADVKMLDTVEAGSSGISEGTEYSSDLSLRVMKSVELKKLNIEEDLEIKNSEIERNWQSIEDNKTTTISEESVCKGNLDNMPPSVCYSTNNLDTKKGALAAISGYSSGEDEPSEDPCDASVLEPADSQVCHSEFENEKDSQVSVVDDIMNDPGSSSPVHPEIKTEAVLSPAAAFYESGGEGSATTSNDFPALGQDTNNAFKIKDFEPLHKEQVKGENEPISDSESNLPVFCSKTREDMEELTAEKEEIPRTEYVAKEDRLQKEENKLRDEDSQNELSEEYSPNKVCGDSKDVLFGEELSKSETAADDSVPVTEEERSSDSEDFGISCSYKPLPLIPPAVSCKEALSSIEGCRESTGAGTLETIVKVEDSIEKISEILSNDEDKSAVKSKPLTDDNEDAETTYDASFGSKSGINEGLNVANDATSMDTPELNVYMSEKHSLQNVEETESISKEAVCEVSRETIYSNKASIKTIRNDIVGECPSDNVEDQDSVQSSADAYMPNLFDKFGKEALRADTRESLVLGQKDNSATVVGSSPVKTADTSDDTFNASANQTATSTDEMLSGDSSDLGTYEKEETNRSKEETTKQDVNLLATDMDHDLHLGPFHGTKFEESDVDLKELSHPEETLKMLTEGVRLHKAGDISVSTYAKDQEQTTLSDNIQEVQHVKRTYLTELSEEDKHIVNMSMEIAEKMNSSDMCGHIEDGLVNTDHADPVGGFKPGRESESAESVDSDSKADLDEGKAVDSAADVSNDFSAKSVEKRPVNDHRIGEELADEIERIKRNQSVEKPTNVVGDSRTSQEITTQDKELIDRNNQFSSDKGSRSNGARTVDIEPRGVPRVVADIDLHPIIPSVSVSNEQQRLTSESETAESSTVNKEKFPQAAKADDYDNATSNLDAASNKLGDSQDNRMSDKNGKQARSASPNVPSRWRQALFRSHAKLQPQIPPSYHSFSMFTGKYQLDTEDTQENDDNVDEMKEMQQQHAFELEKLHIAMEQELLRVENKVQHASSNRKPISACSAVMYQTLEQYAKLGANGNVQPNNDVTDIDELRKTWIQEVLEKYTKLEERVINRQKKEISCLEQQIDFDKLHLLGRKEVLRRKYLAGH